MKNITLRQLRYFEALARHGHFGHAADACSIAQSSLSIQIAGLEASLGTKLFERSTRHARLTRFGENLLPRVRDILRSVDDLGDLARASRDSFVGQLHIGVIPTVAPYLLPALIGRLAEAYPGLDIRLREALTPRLIPELAEGKIDTAIVALPISEPAFTEMPLFSEDFVLVRPMRDQDLPAPNVKALQKMKLLLLEEGHCFRDQALSFCRVHASVAREMMEGSSLSTLVQMVSAGIGVTLIPEMAVPVETRSAAVSVVRFKNAVPTRTIGMIWRKSSPIAHQLKQVSDVVRQAADTYRGLEGAEVRA
jgi:LysR family hydrogen peroxide-inducible transcriptional activator